MDAASTAKNVFAYNQHMVVATVDMEGKPWVSPVFYTYDEHFNFYWVSAKTALHSENIRHNSCVAITIFGPSSSEDEAKKRIHGIYIEAEAAELNNESEISNAAAVMQQRWQPEKYMIKNLSDVTGNATWRIYKATPKEVTKRRDATDARSGQVISVREKIIL